MLSCASLNSQRTQRLFWRRGHVEGTPPNPRVSSWDMWWFFFERPPVSYSMWLFHFVLSVASSMSLFWTWWHNTLPKLVFPHYSQLVTNSFNLIGQNKSSVSQAGKIARLRSFWMHWLGGRNQDRSGVYVTIQRANKTWACAAARG